MRASDFPSAVPSVSSLFQEPDFDTDYFQPNLHFRHTFPTRSHHTNRGNSAWQRASFYEPRALDHAPSDVNEDVLNFTAADLEPVFNVETELRSTLQHLFPIVYAWSDLTIFGKIYAVFQSPLIFVYTFTVPVIHEHHLDVLPTYQPVDEQENNDDAQIEIEDSLGPEKAEYPRMLLFVQMLFAPVIMSYTFAGNSS